MLSVLVARLHLVCLPATLCGLSTLGEAAANRRTPAAGCRAYADAITELTIVQYTIDFRSDASYALLIEQNSIPWRSRESSNLAREKVGAPVIGQPN